MHHPLTHSANSLSTYYVLLYMYAAVNKMCKIPTLLVLDRNMNQEMTSEAMLVN